MVMSASEQRRNDESPRKQEPLGLLSLCHVDQNQFLDEASHDNRHLQSSAPLAQSPSSIRRSTSLDGRPGGIMISPGGQPTPKWMKRRAADWGNVITQEMEQSDPARARITGASMASTCHLEDPFVNHTGDGAISRSPTLHNKPSVVYRIDMFQSPNFFEGDELTPPASAQTPPAASDFIRLRSRANEAGNRYKNFNPSRSGPLLSRYNRGLEDQNASNDTLVKVPLIVADDTMVDRLSIPADDEYDYESSEAGEFLVVRPRREVSETITANIPTPEPTFDNMEAEKALLDATHAIIKRRQSEFQGKVCSKDHDRDLIGSYILRNQAEVNGSIQKDSKFSPGNVRLIAKELDRSNSSTAFMPERVSPEALKPHSFPRNLPGSPTRKSPKSRIPQPASSASSSPTSKKRVSLGPLPLIPNTPKTPKSLTMTTATASAQSQKSVISKSGMVRSFTETQGLIERRIPERGSSVSPIKREERRINSPSQRQPPLAKSHPAGDSTVNERHKSAPQQLTKKIFEGENFKSILAYPSRIGLDMPINEAIKPLDDTHQSPRPPLGSSADSRILNAFSEHFPLLPTSSHSNAVMYAELERLRQQVQTLIKERDDSVKEVGNLRETKDSGTLNKQIQEEKELVTFWRRRAESAERHLQLRNEHPGLMSTVTNRVPISRRSTQERATMA